MKRSKNQSDFVSSVGKKLSRQMGRRSNKKSKNKNELTVSTGSTLLDLAISGGRFYKGGLPTGILVEIFGPASSGKTVLLSEIAGNVRRLGGEVMFLDPEARLNKEFAKLFGLDPEEVDYSIPSTILDVFGAVRKWEPKDTGKIHGVFADSLAALTTEWEIADKDQYGMRRAKEFSEQCRLVCRELPKRNIIMVCSNQVRQNLDLYGPRYKSPGGEAVGFYSSLRLRCTSPIKIKRKRRIAKKEISRTIGIETEVEVFKSSLWKPFRTAPVYILYDYGIDDIRANLQFIKTNTGATTYSIGDHRLASSIEEAIT
ncbi:MAG: hypothetical protein GWN01_09330, partial [Nitrosopumilaceae archaeon]|nr:hypothetical protein [Nitrosopumilaceae archaeon]NIU87811.1 hypothetical protein [Nitrosopumilaceae archaeon]NIV65193.1 hypothetical protein [Nitrosopumilaceae archaeon]NIX61709.1 hypothetical protein [Nitrosopumilaceae archaeon]